MIEPNRDGSKEKSGAANKPYQATEEHVRIMAEYIFKRDGRPATLNEAQDALNNLTRLMKWLYEHRNDLNKKQP